MALSPAQSRGVGVGGDVVGRAGAGGGAPGGGGGYGEGRGLVEQTGQAQEVDVGRRGRDGRETQRDDRGGR